MHSRDAKIANLVGEHLQKKKKKKKKKKKQNDRWRVGAEMYSPHSLRSVFWGVTTIISHTTIIKLR
jgi:hypothetical protein